MNYILEIRKKIFFLNGDFILSNWKKVDKVENVFDKSIYDIRWEIYGDKK